MPYGWRISSRQLPQRRVERCTGGRREHEHPVLAVQLARWPLIAAIEARDERDVDARGVMLGQPLEQVECAVALAGATADTHGRRSAASGKSQLGRERDRGEVVARWTAAVLGKLDEPRQLDLITACDVLKLEPERSKPGDVDVLVGG
jgi:hypothetical protein